VCERERERERVCVCEREKPLSRGETWSARRTGQGEEEEGGEKEEA